MANSINVNGCSVCLVSKKIGSKFAGGGNFITLPQITKIHIKMKRILLLFAAVVCVAFVGCSKDDGNDGFKYGDAIYGTWDVTHVKSDGSWIDITSPLFSKYQASATFNADGTYSGSGYFGTGSGTYKASGNTIVCYISGSEYARYDVRSLSDNVAEMTMTMAGSSVDIRCKKR